MSLASYRTAPPRVISLSISHAPTPAAKNPFYRNVGRCRGRTTIFLGSRRIQELALAQTAEVRLKNGFVDPPYGLLAELTAGLEGGDGHGNRQIQAPGLRRHRDS